MSYEMYEDFKETMVKTLKNEIAALVPAAQPIDTELLQRIEQIIGSEQERQRTIMTRLAGRLERIEQNHIKMQAGMDDLQSSVDAIEIPAELPPRITQHRISRRILVDDRHDDNDRGTLHVVVPDGQTELRPHRQRPEVPLP